MPLSMAACRTVLPFSTETWRPSMVNVTVSIALKDISNRLFDEFSEGAVVFIDLDVLQGAGERQAPVDRLFTHSDHDVRLLLVDVLQRQGDRNVEDFAELVDVNRQLTAVDVIGDLQTRQRRSMNPLV